MALTFVHADTATEGWSLQVLRFDRPVGWILRGEDGSYRFYKGTSASTAFLPAPLVEDKDLARLKEWLEANL